jgi:hypothetical protein
VSTRAALVTGTALSLAVTAAWSYMATLTIGPAGPLDLSLHHPLASYAALADGPAGNGWELFAVVAFIYAACLLISGWRRSRAGDGDG